MEGLAYDEEAERTGAAEQEGVGVAAMTEQEGKDWSPVRNLQEEAVRKCY